MKCKAQKTVEEQQPVNEWKIQKTKRDHVIVSFLYRSN